MKINLKGDIRTGTVWLNGELLDPKPSQKYRNHSPDGFNWGYAGSGPSQLALAVVMKVYGDPETAPIKYQDFKFKHICAIPPGVNFDVDIEIPKK